MRNAGLAGLQALAFDAFPIFDPRPVFARCEQLYPGRGGELANLWRVRQFEYQWLRALSGSYADFWKTTEDALVFAAASLKLPLSPAQRQLLMSGYLELPAWPDATAALQSLRQRGLRLAFLSNATRKILDAGIRNARLEGVFERVLSTDDIRAYKPDPRAYRMAVDAFGLPREKIGFVAFAGWDAAGAKTFGYPTFWVNRLGTPPEELGAQADAVIPTLADLPALLQG